MDGKNERVFLTIAEVSYLSFWAVMLFAKGIGLYDGQGLYKLLLVIALGFLTVKLLLTRLTYLELAASALLALLSVAVYAHSGEKGVLLCVAVVIGMKNMSVTRVFQVGLAVWSVALPGRFFLSLLDLGGVFGVPQTKNMLGDVFRYFMGFPHPNVLHISYLTLTAFVIYCLRERYRLFHFLALLAGNVLLFFYSYSLTGFLSALLYLGLAYLVNRKEPGRLAYALAEAVFAVCLLVSIVLPVLAEGWVFTLADRIFNNRINYSRYFLTGGYLAWFGNRVSELTTDVLSIDNSFVFVLIFYGLLMFVLMSAAYALLIHHCVREKKKQELAMIVAFLAAGTIEPFLFNTSFKNLTLIFVGEFFFRLFAGNGGRQMAALASWDVKFSLSVGRGRRMLRLAEEISHQFNAKIAVISAGLAGMAAALQVYAYQMPRNLQEHYSKGIMDISNMLLFDRIRAALTGFILSFALMNMAGCVISYRRKEAIGAGDVGTGRRTR